MYDLVDNLADLTALRDRGALDVALVNTISDLLLPRCASIYRAIGEQGKERWRLSAQVWAGKTCVIGDTVWTPFDQLHSLSQFPLRKKAMAEGIQESISEEHVVVFPLGSPSGNAGVLELLTDAPLSTERRDLISGILRLYRNFSALLDYGERDSLTDLLNRKTFDGAFLRATLEQKSSGGRDKNYPQTERRDIHTAATFWLAMIDIDHFKRVNDNFGHLIGDEVLLLLARMMRSHFRFHDQIYRFGGEEFVVLVRCHSEVETSTLLDRLRITAQHYAFPQVGTITLSIGFTEIRAGDSPSGAIERADKAVYYAKEHGRNQVCSYSALVSNGALIEPTTNIGDVELF
ncbi:GGDEF domain-containing protein [Rhodoferax sp. GW822-FHT02A01]|uniref:GGDEF domain-containing protein n=1 Tax=Rhodoferax sp. GW822-FHT02A01 TaxID=3141537 RepID=UPI00315D0B4C